MISFWPSKDRKLLFHLSLREDDLKYKEEDHHGDASRDECHEDIVDCRCNIRRRDRHPQIVESVADQGDHDPCDKIPHCLVYRVSVALEGDVPLEREIDALRHEGSYLIADKVA